MTMSQLCPNPSCREPILAEDAFCEGCGQRLDGPVPDHLRCAYCPGAVADEYCGTCGMRQPRDGDRVEVSTDLAAGVSDIGRRHKRNEDALALATPATDQSTMVAVVCDGVSSAPQSDEASRVAATTGAETLAKEITAGADPVEATHTALAHAAEAAAALAASVDHAPACTYVSAVVAADPDGDSPGGHNVTVGWVGDSRAYWVSSGAGADPPAVLTQDDSWAEYMVSQGVLSYEEAQAAPTANALVGWVGADAGKVTGRVTRFAPTGPGAIVLCSDGLWNYLPEPQALADAVPDAGADPLRAAQTYTQIANDAGGRDNITVVVIPVPLNPQSAGRR